ncbi:MAG: polysaccharide biosynthesis/export family protein, partial [Leptolyngbya sp.]|nr:polysaccharide biosynthesis/export family protein [Leptolyngbya sp.]
MSPHPFPALPSRPWRRRLAIAAIAAYLCLPGSHLPVRAQTPTLPGAERSYGVLRTGDLVEVTVLGFPDLSGQQPISADGTLQLPMVGSLAVAGLTPPEAVARLTTALRPYVRRPEVGLVVLESRPLRISVTGEVSQPGPYRVGREDLGGDPFPTLSAVLGLAGGITPQADLRHIVIRRSPAPRVTEEQRLTEIPVNFWATIQQGSLANDPLIMDGDEIIVPRAEALTPEQQQQSLRSTVAPTALAVNVAGEVRQPGRTLIDPVGGVSAAVAAAGGPSENANLNSIILFRMAPNGQLTQQTFRFGEDSGPLQQGDVILVDRNTTSAVGNVFDFIGTILNPFGALSNIFDND